MTGLSNHTKIVNLIIDLVKPRAPNSILSNDFDILWFENTMSSGVRENRSTWPVDITLRSKDRSSYIFVECKGGTFLNDDDITQLKRYQQISPSDAESILGSVKAPIVNYLYVITSEAFENWEDLINKEKIPILIYTPDHVKLEGKNLFDPIKSNLNGFELTYFPFTYYPFSSNDDEKYIYNFIVSGLIAYLAAFTQQTLDLTFNINDILKKTHPFYSYNIYGDEKRALEQISMRIINKILSIDKIKNYIEKIPNKNILQSRFNLIGRLDTLIDLLKDQKQSILKITTLDEYF